MKFRLWHNLSVAFLFASLSFGLASCSSQDDQQADDQVVQGQEDEDQDQDQDQQDQDQDQQDQDQEYDEGQDQQGQDEQYQEGEDQGENYADNGAQNAQQQDELQEIIDGMNEQQTAENQAPAEASEQYAQEVPVQTAPENLSVPEAEPAPVEQQAAPAFAGMPAGAGLPELGSKMSYIVGSGDTLATIAMKVYGDIEKWREIAEFTGMANPNMIYPGDVVYYQLTEQTMAFASAYESMAQAEVVVRPGDTLSTISSNVLGSSKDWKMIWRLNDTINNPDVLEVGQVLYYRTGGVSSAALSPKKDKKIVKNVVKQVKTAERKSIAKIDDDSFALPTNNGFSRII